MVAAAVGAAWYLQKPKYPWLFKGAYAEYEGSAVAFIFPVEVKMRIEVLDYNDTHAKLLVRMTTSFMGESVTDENVTWVELGHGTYLMGGEEPDEAYEATITLPGFGERRCMVYVYKEGNVTTKLYVDKEIVWPLKVEVDSVLFKLELKLTDTNIEALKK